MRARAAHLRRMDRDRRIAREILRRHPRSRAEALGVDVGRDTPMPLFQWLCASLLFSARISADIAESAARALFKAGWRTPHAMRDAGWEARTRTLNEAGYARYDESASRYLGEAAARCLELYRGDLRRMRAPDDPQATRKAVMAFKGIGEVGADIFVREAQVAWPELHPFADARALKTAEALGLPSTAEGLAALVSPRDLPRLLDGLIRADRDGELDALRHAS